MLAESAEMLWNCLANVNEGNWGRQTQEWQEAACRWRSVYFEALRQVNAYLAQKQEVKLPEEIAESMMDTPEGVRLAKRFNQLIRFLKEKERSK